jgi:hypothetical protein
MFMKLTPGANVIIQYLVNYHNNSNPSFSRVKNCNNLLPFHGNLQCNIALQHYDWMVVNYRGKKFYNIGTRCQFHQHFWYQSREASVGYFSMLFMATAIGNFVTKYSAWCKIYSIEYAINLSVYTHWVRQIQWESMGTQIGDLSDVSLLL